jgi:hypothetical protein
MFDQSRVQQARKSSMSRAVGQKDLAEETDFDCWLGLSE